MNEVDYTILLAMRDLGWRFRILTPTLQFNYFFPFKMPEWADIWYCPGFGDVARELEQHLKYFDADAVIVRAGWGIEDKCDQVIPNLCRKYGTPAIMWCNEQGPERDWQMARARPYSRVWCNNRMDVEHYIKSCVSGVEYFPFGCVPSFHKRVTPREEYKCDVVCYSNPCYGRYESKTWCVNNMIRPLSKIKCKTHLWGTPTWDFGGFDLFANRWVKASYRGKFPYPYFPIVNSSAKMMVGLSANRYHGGYGSKLAGAMGCGILCFYPYTKGIELDLENCEHMVWCENKFAENVTYYLEDEDERERVALNGQKYAYEHWNYVKNFPEIFKRCDL